MPKIKITDYDVTAANNTDVGNININTNCDFGNVDNALREILRHLAEMNAGTYPLADTVTFGDPADLTKRFRLDAGSVTAGTTRVITIPDSSGVMMYTNFAIGFAQAWIDVRSLREFSTAYQNTTGRTIVVALAYYGTGGAGVTDYSIQVSADNVSYVTVDYCQAPSPLNLPQSLTTLVPPNYYYKLTRSLGTGTGKAFWSELR